MNSVWLVVAGIVAASCVWAAPDHVPRTYLFQYAETASISLYRRAHGSVYRHEPWMGDEQWEAHHRNVVEGWPRLLESVEALQPDILYLAANSAFNIFGMTQEDIPTLEQLRAQIEAQRAELDEYGARGVEDVGFYQCAVTVRGNPDARHRIFALYDRWEEYAEVLNLGPKPPEDPIEWLQIRFDNGQPYIRKWDKPDAGGNLGYMCCVNNPYWRRYAQAMVQTGAEIGYTNLFVDNPSVFCKCEWCREAFADFQRERFTREQWERLFPEIAWGEGDIDDERLAAERVRFWQESVGAHLTGLKDAMRRGNPGARITLSANGSRMTLGPWYTSRPNLSQFAGAGVDLGFKESPFEFSGVNLRPVGSGLLAVEPGNIHDGYRIARAASADYYACPAQAYANLQANDRLYRLAMSEALAMDGCFLDGARLGAELPSREPMYDYLRTHGELFRPGESVARVAVILGDAEYYFDEDFYADAFRDTKAIRDWLDERQVPFDYLLESAITPERLTRYETVILPGFKALMDATGEAMREYAAGGGSLIVSGPVGTHHPAGPERDAPLLAEMLTGASEEDGLLRREIGEGRVIACPLRFADADLPAGYSMTGYTISRPQTLGGKTRGPLVSVAVETNRELFLRALDAATRGEPALVRGEPRPGLRVAGRQALDGDDPWLALHVINERMMMRFTDSAHGFDLQQKGEPHIYRSVPIVAPLPEGFRAKSVRWAAVPAGEPEPLEFTHVSGAVACELAEVEMYSVLLVALEPGAPVAVGDGTPRSSGAGFGAYVAEGDAPVPAPAGSAEAATDVPLRLNFTHPALIHAEAGDEMRVSVSAHGPAGRWARWWVAGPDGAVLRTGAVECGQTVEASVTAEETAVYLLQAQAGAHDVSYASTTHGLCYPATEAQRLGFTGAVPKLDFFIPGSAETVPLMLQTRDRNGVFEIADSDGNVLATRDGLGQAEIVDAGGAMVWSDKSSGAVYQRLDLPVPEGQAGRVWTLRFVASTEDSPLRSYLYFADDFPGYLSADGRGLLTIRG